MPTYGARSRPARISSIRNAAEHTNTSAAAMSAGIGAVSQPVHSAPPRERPRVGARRPPLTSALVTVVPDRDDYDDVVVDTIDLAMRDGSTTRAILARPIADG